MWASRSTSAWGSSTCSPWSIAGWQSSPAAPVPGRRGTRPRPRPELQSGAGGSDCAGMLVQGPLAAGDLNGGAPGVPPDEIITSEGGATMGFLGFTNALPLTWGDSPRTVPIAPLNQASVESAAVGDLDNDGDPDVLVGQPVNSLSARVESIHYFLWRRHRPGAGRATAVVDPGARRRGGRRRRRERLQRRGGRRRLRPRDDPPRRLRRELRRRSGPPAARLPEPGDGHPHDPRRGRPVGRRPARTW